ncbi:uncharacterized protein CANTADRAFT_51951 [Suhomyces tanzawaensis NRRL Y-17324]|uniref:Thioredoxin-like protein n=1 Tax=Suhomyces tanzawaensis NRRL Y-17324 TaxID=984487 RepID=A0A1E4SIT0_9ASCO|nr:uncharacterized protein CANTADRAFT_51951 [Suhomyces tanzawaensis NRRL Y-17324]ODV79415.1 hypothetical protein CANTADRAFT_51951 [Suhomyces tanzawaensis NRRL Y-17324]
MFTTRAAILTRSVQPSTRLGFTRTFFNGWFKAWQTQKVIYPPKPQDFTTNNRIFEAYVQHANELHDYLLFKEPLLLNFTYADPKSNKVTQALFDVLSNRDKYPTETAVNLVNIMADTEGGRELMLDYGVGKIPSVVLLRKQIPVDRLVVDVDRFSEQDVIEWLRSIR